MPNHSYYAGKSDLFMWVNQLLDLNISTLEELSNGAAYCQILDAYYENKVSLHKVNFQARKEYEIFSNYKILQASLNSAGFNRDLNLEGLLRGGQGNVLELLQWMFMSLNKQKPLPSYDAKSKRKVTLNGGSSKIPLPAWRSNKFDVFGRSATMGSNRRLVNTLSGTESVAGHPRVLRTAFSQQPVRQTSTSRSPLPPANRSQGNGSTTPNGNNIGGSGSLSPVPPKSPLPTRSPSHQHRKAPSSDPNANPRHEASPDNSKPAKQAWRSPRASPMRNNGSLMLSSKGISIPRLKLEALSGTSDTSLKVTPDGSNRSSKPRSVGRRSPMSPAQHEWKGTPKDGATKSLGHLLAEIVPVCLKAAAQAVSSVIQASETLQTLIEHVGTSQDTYACRAKLHSLRDAMNTLIRHTTLLLDDLGGPVSRLRESESSQADRLFTENSMLIRRLEGGRKKFHDHVIVLSSKEQAHPVPKGTSASGLSDQLRERTESDNLDGALRKVGAAKAALGRALQKVGGLETVSNTGTQFADPKMELEPSELESGVTEGIETTPAADIDGRGDETEASISVGYPDGINYPGNSEVYKGQYVHGKKCGHGTYTFVNGDVYQGEFKDDEMHGCGLYTFSHEGHYEGQWVMGVYEGVGTETFALGSTYHGQYTEGSRNGWGVCRYYNGDYYEGQWREGLREGRGMQQCTDDSNFVGDYLYGKRHGWGVYNFPNGDRYYGEYVNDIPHGHGVYRFSNGQKYEGQWQAGKKHGYCVYTVETKGVWERWAGEWEEGRPVWVESLSRWDNDISGMPSELRGKMEQALKACRMAQDAGETGMSRADEHWQTDGSIQKSIREVVQRADKAAILARQAQKNALEVAARLDAAENRKKTNAVPVLTRQ
ncbi:hypothetical protein BSKO_09187 [Bryopsis sp. KO-2023]|nr:hypothetical protein BSKO_09187 [Bryopsis sp. KO-2023]